MNSNRGGGFCVWLTGLSASGKTTTAQALAGLLEGRGRVVTVLDGDQVRTNISKGLGFTAEDRLTNIRRIGSVASEIVSHGGAVIAAAISPYRSARDECRVVVGESRFIEVYVNTPLHTCIARDPKRLYARALAGEVHGLTGIDDPYEPPLSPEIVLDTVSHSASENAARILAFVTERGLV